MNHSAKFKATVALAAIGGKKTLVEISPAVQAHRNQIGQWRWSCWRALLRYSPWQARCWTHAKTLHAEIGQLTLENDFWLQRSVASAIVTESAQTSRG